MKSCFHSCHCCHTGYCRSHRTEISDRSHHTSRATAIVHRSETPIVRSETPIFRSETLAVIVHRSETLAAIVHRSETHAAIVHRSEKLAGHNHHSYGCWPGFHHRSRIFQSRSSIGSYHHSVSHPGVDASFGFRMMDLCCRSLGVCCHSL